MSTNINSALITWRKEIFLHPATASSTPRVLVSACLTGLPVRYDGKDKACDIITQRLASNCQLLTICPETAAGFPVPRPPVQLIQTNNATPIQALGVNDKTLNVTEILLRSAEQQIARLPFELSGACLKSRSPSCGKQTTPVYDLSGSTITFASGLFAQQLQQYRPWLVFSDENILHNEQDYLWFLWRILVNHDIFSSSSPQQLTAQSKHYRQLLMPFDIRLIADSETATCYSLAIQLQDALKPIGPAKRMELLDFFLERVLLP